MQRIHILLLALLASLAQTACKNDPPAQQQDPNKPQTIVLPNYTEESKEGADTLKVTDAVVVCIGNTGVGKNTQLWEIPFSGTAIVKNGHLLGGNFTFDLTSIKSLTEQAPDAKKDWEAYLKGPACFDVAKNPKAQLFFDEVLPSQIPTFNAVVPAVYTAKGKRGEVNMPVKISGTGSELLAETATFPVSQQVLGFANSGVPDKSGKVIVGNVGMVVHFKTVGK